MKQDIIHLLDNPAHLEKLYQSNKSLFSSSFNAIYPQICHDVTAQVWYERLNYSSNKNFWGTKTELTFVIILGMMAGIMLKLPLFECLKQYYDSEHYYSRNIGFIATIFLMVYFAWKNNLSPKTNLIVCMIVVFTIIYINLIPGSAEKDHTVFLACIHVPLLLWLLLGHTFIGDENKRNSKMMDYFRFNGDFMIIEAVIVFIGALIIGMTQGLFSAIGIDISKLLFEYIAIFAIAASPIVSALLLQNNPNLVNKVSPLVAKIFTPVVLVVLTIYLVAVLIQGQDPYADRDFLLIFNLILIGVIALIFFSISETDAYATSKVTIFMLLALAVITLIINLIALSAISYRIWQWGFTPNRIAVIGSNILFFFNLALVANTLYRSIREPNKLVRVEHSIANFMPYYGLWVLFMIFILPLIYQFK